MKKKILISTEYLKSGGVEVSLIRFINELSKNKNIDIDLLLLKREGIYLNKVPKNVNIIELQYADDLYRYDSKISDIKKISGLKKIKFLNYKYKLKKFKENNKMEEYYKEILKYVKKNDVKYDLAIDYLGYGHFITAVIGSDKISAKYKITWIHDEKNEWLSNVDCWLDYYDKIFCVGKACLNNALKNNRKLKDKLEVFYNMTDYLNVRKKAESKMNFEFDKNKLNIITVGRLEWQKAYDVAIETAEILKNRNINFCWYAIGGGSLEEELKNMVLEKKLEDNFKFLGIVSNPFPYVKNASLYVLSSRHEGYCLATLEAKILGSVIIATDIESNREQITDGENGFLCELSPEIFADKIIEVSNNKKLMEHVRHNLELENFDYTYQFNDLYKMIDKKK